MKKEEAEYMTNTSKKVKMKKKRKLESLIERGISKEIFNEVSWISTDYTHTHLRTHTNLLSSASHWDVSGGTVGTTLISE